ncbi:beta-phosphoglucomutase [Enterococcus raffinosus]|uniref:beta-phosphoglucomutase n=1 Tax=Enterococcus raffinosus TaxID=71452 RepID=UPI00040552B4|nr:beta-phosphoglucomutase [Enterococcus raffinosus]
MFKGVLFDLDGVIADTSTLHFDAWKKLVNKYFSVALPDSIEEKTKGVSRTDSLKVILESLDVVVSDSMFQQLLHEKNELYGDSLNTLSPNNILPGIAPFISELKEQKMKLALASASLNGPLILEKLALSTAFDAVADPSKVACGKPAPDIFISAAKALGLTPTVCVGIEDSIAGISAINSSGAFSVAVGKNPQLQSANLILPSTAELRLDTLRIAYSN